MNQFVNKIKNYIDQKYLIKNVDNKHWQLVDNFHDKVSIVLKQDELFDCKRYYPAIDLDKLKKDSPEEYKFLENKFTRYIYKINNCLLDPDYNWVILGPKKIFRFSYPLIEDPWDAVKPRPSVIRGIFKSKPIDLEKAILVKYAWTNYYHFIVDTLAQIYLCDDNGISSDIPVLVPHNFKKHAYVSTFLSIFPLKRKIIVQEKGQYIRVKELYTAKEIFCNNYVDQIKAQVINKDITADILDVPSPELLFITRKKGTRRSLSNIDVVEQLARENGFSVIDPGDYSWIEQVKLFSAAKRIIGVHGAGLTNIIFCKSHNVKILEILPGKGLNPEHYENIAKKLNYGYISIKGNGLDASGQFSIDIDLLKDNIKQLIVA